MALRHARHVLPGSPRTARPSAVPGRTADVRILLQADTGQRLLREEGPHARTDLGPVRSIEHAQALARRATGHRRVHFAPQSRLCVTLSL
jgi:hypothetical protein